MMNVLKVQKYLQSKSLQDLTEEFGIKVTKHPTLPLVLLKYNQIDSPKSHPIVRECRGLVLEEHTWKIVAKGFNRFFNVGEIAEEFSQFNWSNFDVYSKEDGSLILLYYYQGQWRVNTSGSFGEGIIDSYAGTWRELFWDVASFTEEDLQSVSKTQTLVFELCTPYNKVVRMYTPSLYLLGIFDHSSTPKELDRHQVDIQAQRLGVKRPQHFNFNSQEEVKQFILRMEEEDSTFEGVVLRDNAGMRYKWKTQTYLSLHRMKDNGNILHPKNLVPIILANEQSEVIAVMPECKSALLEAERMMNQSYQSLEAKWVWAAQEAKTQKDFAMMVKDHPLCGILFTLRKNNPKASVKDLKRLWRDSGSQILKVLFRNKRFTFDLVEVT